MPRMLTVAAWAAELGISRQAAHKAVQRLAVPVTDGLIDADLAHPAYAARTRRRVRSNPAGTAQAPLGDGMSYDEARRRLAVAEAARAELELQELAGDLVRRDAVRAALSRRLTAAREVALNVPARLAPLLVGVAGAAEAEALLTAEMNAFLATLAEVAP